MFGEVTGGGSYDDLVDTTIFSKLDGICCLTLKRLIEVEDAACGQKDPEAMAELEALLEEAGASISAT